MNGEAAIQTTTAVVEKVNRLTLSFVLKPVGNICNLRCDYCFYRDHNEYEVSRVWSPQQGIQIINWIHQYTFLWAKGHPRTVRCIWHGGEPLLATKEFYQAVLNEQENLSKMDSKINFFNTVQTNGVCDEDLLLFLNDNGFTFGVSFDGLPWLHDLHRVNHKGIGTSKIVLETISKLKRVEGKVAVTIVITSDAIGYAKEIYQFVKSLRVKKMAISPCLDLSHRKALITTSQYADFMIELFRVWIEDDDPNFMVRELAEWIRGILKKKLTLCTFNPSHCGNFPSIGPDGNVYYCDNYDTIPELMIGSIQSENIDQVFNEHLRIKNEVYSHRKECENQNCRYISACFSGCPRQWQEGKNIFCGAHRKIFRIIEKFLLKRGYEIPK